MAVVEFLTKFELSDREAREKQNVRAIYYSETCPVWEVEKMIGDGCQNGDRRVFVFKNCAGKGVL